MGHPDFRIGGKIFATMGAPNDEWAMVKLTPEQQRSLIESGPNTFRPCNGAWGRSGCTLVHLPAAKKGLVKAAIEIAFENVATTVRYKASSKRIGKDKPQPRTGKLKKSVVDKVTKRVFAVIRSLPEATANASGDHYSLEVRGKRFGYFLVDHHGDGRIAINVKADADNSKTLATKYPQRFHIPKYIGRYGWVGLWLDLPVVDWQEVVSVMKEAYRLAAPKALVKQMQ
jgi:predicted DNA-binding protein (MmcQ/YjbR family)